jgi:hypothetical protein
MRLFENRRRESGLVETAFWEASPRDMEQSLIDTTAKRSLAVAWPIECAADSYMP